MGLAEYLSERLICMDLEPSQRDEAVQALLELFVADGAMPAELVGPARQAIVDRERLGSTAIGRGVAVPHARLEGVERILVAFGHSRKGIEFNALDGQPVHQVFLVLAPNGAAEQYLNVMERITRLVQNDDFRRFVSQLRSAAEVMELIEEMDH